jgi:hypothetical protein
VVKRWISTIALDIGRNNQFPTWEKAYLSIVSEVRYMPDMNVSLPG